MKSIQTTQKNNKRINAYDLFNDSFLKRSLYVDPVISVDAFVPEVIMKATDISPFSKILYGTILSLSKELVFFGNLEMFCTFYKMTPRQISETIKELIKINVLEKLTDPEKKEILEKKNLIGIGTGYLQCEWCKMKCNLLHEHHYPIRRLHKGEETVNICPTCHAEFHNSLFLRLVVYGTKD